MLGRALHAAGSTVEDMGVDLGCADVPVTEELLDGPDVVVVLEEVGGEGVAKRVTGCALRDGRPAHGLLHRPLEHGLVQVVPAPLARGAIQVETGRWDHPLPDALPPAVEQPRLGHLRMRRSRTTGAALDSSSSVA